MLCSMCWSIFDHWCSACNAAYKAAIQQHEDDDEDVLLVTAPFPMHAHHKDESSVMAARADGCQICLAISEDAWPTESAFDGFPTLLLYQIEWFASGYMVKVLSAGPLKKLEFSEMRSNDSSRRKPKPVELATFQVTLCEDQTYSNDGLLPRTTDIADALSLLRTWLARCDASHAKCAPSHYSGFCPTRLLDIRRAPDGPTHVRVIETQLLNSDDCDIYVTLSHCWGKHVPIKLLRDTELMLKFGVEVSELPKTFKHAIEIARAFSIHYIWIDSLCIKQDDKDDWRREAGLMSAVYTNAVFNIAATAAENSTQGLFFERNPHSIQPTEVFPVWPEMHGKCCTISHRNFTRSEFAQQPLLSRAWVFQERLLARRVIHFTRTQIFWECNTTFASEGFPQGIDDRIKRKRLYLKSDPPQPIWYWLDIVPLYTKYSLTYNDDKLIALSGIARRVHEDDPQNHDVYLAGLWKSQLPYSLHWRIGGVDPVRKLNSTKSQYRGPSWSWASMDEAIIYSSTPNHGPFWDYIKRAEYRKHDIELKTTDTFGDVTAASLSLQAPIAGLKINLDTSADQFGYSGYPRAVTKLAHDLDGQRTAGSCTSFKPLGVLGTGQFDFDFNKDIGIEVLEDYCRDIVGLLLFSRELKPKHRTRGQPNTTFYGLMLKQIKKGSYERVGEFSVLVEDYKVFDEQGFLVNFSTETVKLV